MSNLGTVQKQLRQFWLGLLPTGFVARSLQTHWQGMLVAGASPAGKIPAPLSPNLFLHGPLVGYTCLISLG